MTWTLRYANEQGRDYFIVDAKPYMPDIVKPLVGPSREEGFGNMTKLYNHWVDGSSTFDQPGERLLAAVTKGEDGLATLGVGGLKQCYEMPGAMRVNRFYVIPFVRRMGIASALAKELIDQAQPGKITCNSHPTAFPFWESLGFKRQDGPGEITHVMDIL